MARPRIVGALNHSHGHAFEKKSHHHYQVKPTLEAWRKGGKRSGGGEREGHILSGPQSEFSCFCTESRT